MSTTFKNACREGIWSSGGGGFEVGEKLECLSRSKSSEVGLCEEAIGCRAWLVSCVCRTGEFR